MKLHHIRAFLAVHEHGSLRAAAAALDMTQPALTKSLKQLEKELGVTLFERSIRGMQATSFGRSFAVRARMADAELRRGVEEIQHMRGLHEGQIGVGVSPAPAMQLLPMVLRRFHAQYPHVSLRLVDGQYPFYLPSLRDGSLDFVVGPRPPEVLSTEFHSEVLFTNPNTVLCRQGHPLAGAKRVEELQDVEWVLPSMNRGPSMAISDLFHARGLGQPKCRVSSETLTVTQALVAETDLMTVLPLGGFLAGAIRPDIIRVDLEDRVKAYEICIISRAGVPLSPAAQVLADVFRRTPARFVTR